MKSFYIILFFDSPKGETLLLFYTHDIYIHTYVCAYFQLNKKILKKWLKTLAVLRKLFSE